MLLATVALLAAGCTPNQPPPDQTVDKAGNATLRESVSDSQPIQKPTIQDDVSYSIIDSTAIAGIKRSLDVRLNTRVAEDTLHAIALKLKSTAALLREKTDRVRFRGVPLHEHFLNGDGQEPDGPLHQFLRVREQREDEMDLSWRVIYYLSKV